MITPRSVVCPTCRARVGRECTDRRGYLLTSGTHRARSRLFLAQLAGDTTAAPQAVAERGRGARGATPERVSRGVAQSLPEPAVGELVLF